MSPDVVQLLRDVPLPEEPFDRYGGVVARRRTGDRRRYAALGTALATVLVVGGISAVTLRTPDAKDRTSVLSATPTTAHVVGTGSFGAGEGLTLTGDVDFTHHASDFVLSLGAASPGGEPQRTRQIGDERWTYQSGLNGKSGFWLHEADGADDDFEQLDPQTLFSRLRADQNALRELGTQDIDGVPTTHYAVPQQKDVDGSPFAEADGDVYVDAQGLVRRLVVTQLEGSFTFTFSRFGEPVDITPPPASQVKEASDLIPKGQDCTTTPSTSGSSAYSSTCTITSGGVQVQPSLSPEAKAMLCSSLRKAFADHPEKKSFLENATRQLGC